MKSDPHNYPYPSQRNVTYAKNGMVATSQPLAAQAGLDMLKKGGNAIDAAIAAAACLTVVEPTSNGIGGDAFALVWAKGKLHGLNSSGPAPASISINSLKDRGYTSIPDLGWIPVTVPGAPGAWVELSERFGKLSFETVMAPAIEYAKNGFPVSPNTGLLWAQNFDVYKAKAQREEFKHWFETFAPCKRAPEAGEIWGSLDHAKTLTDIAQTRGESFYRGKLAEKIGKFSKKYNGYLTTDDMACFSPEWVDPIGVDYQGYHVWEIPPNGQGLVALMALNILNGYSFSTKESVETYHRQIEAIKLAFADGQKYITEHKKMKIGITGLLSEKFARERRALIGEKAILPQPGTPPASGTVYLAAADGQGNMISYIQSNYKGFGSGLVVPGTGIALQNRGCNFSFDLDHPNCLEPGKRTFHTIIPGFLTKKGEPVGPFGVMGGFMQPQGHLQVVMNMIDFDLNPQAALDAPRWQWIKDKIIEVEHSVPIHISRELKRKGHDIMVALESTRFGRGQIICKNSVTGVLSGGTDPRTDGVVAAW